MEDILDFEESLEEKNNRYLNRIQKLKRINRFLYLGIIFYPVLIRIPVTVFKGYEFNLQFAALATGRIIGYCLAIWLGSLVIGSLIALIPFGHFPYNRRFFLSALYTSWIAGLLLLSGFIYSTIVVSLLMPY